MEDAIRFFRKIRKETHVFEIDIPQALAQTIPEEATLTLDDAIAMGVDVSEVRDKNNAKVFREMEVRRIRRKNALEKGCVDIDEQGNLLIPTAESLREQAETPEYKPAVTFLEPEEEIHTRVMPEVFQPALPNQEMPAVSGVFIPPIYGREQYEKSVEMTSGSNDFPSAECAEIILSLCHLFRENGELYVFSWEEGRYKKMNRDQTQVLIDQLVGERIRKANKVKAYAEIEKFLRYDVRLEVSTENRLPLNFWAFKNGILDIRTGSFNSNDGRFFVRTALNCQYSPGACCPMFDAFLEAVSGGDSALIALIWEIIGYILSPDNRAKVFFALIGPKDTGKSLFANILTQFFTSDAISLLGASDFSGKFDVSELKDKRLNECMDLPDIPLSPIAVAKIKALTGGDIVRSDVKYKESVAFRSEAKLLFGANALLRVEVPDQAFTDRLLTIPFCHQIPKEKQDKSLNEKICCELPGIAKKAVDAYLRLAARNLVFQEVGVPEALGIRFDFDKVVMDFAREECEFSPTSRITTEKLFNAFAAFCLARRVGSIEKNDFSERFNRLFSTRVTKKKIKFDGVPLQGYDGVTLREWKNGQ